MFDRFRHKDEKQQSAPQPGEQVEEVQTVSGDDDIEPDGDSPNELEFFSNGQILKTIRANIASSSQAGPNVRTRRGIMLALDDTTTPNRFRLDMHGKTLLQFFIDLHKGGV